MDKVYGFKVKSGGPCPVLDPWELIVNRHTLPGTTISHHRVVMKISFLFQCWDKLVTSRVVVVSLCLFIQVSKNKLCHGFLQEAVLHHNCSDLIGVMMLLLNLTINTCMIMRTTNCL